MFSIKSKNKILNIFVFFSTECQEDQCDYLFVLDSVAHLDNPDTLIKLISLNRTIISPMLIRPEKTWSNFWGDYTDEGYYKRSPDYIDIINYNKIGLFNIPHVAHCYLINGTLLKSFTPEYIHPTVDPDVKFCQSIRDAVRRERIELVIFVNLILGIFYLFK
jgi:hypothetical protein